MVFEKQGQAGRRGRRPLHIVSKVPFGSTLWPTRMFHVKRRRPKLRIIRVPVKRECSFPPLGLLSPPNPLRSRWRLCRLTDAACPLRVLRWASAGAPVTASASQWGGRQCTPGLCKPDTAHRRHEPPFWGSRGRSPWPFFPPISSGRNGGPGRAGPPREGHPGVGTREPLIRLAFGHPPSPQRGEGFGRMISAPAGPAMVSRTRY